MNPVLLTVRGTTIPKTIDEARSLHNATAGSAPGMEAARSASDISHCVYTPVTKNAGKLSDSKAGEILFLDRWQDPAGLQGFFGNHEVQAQAGKMFSARAGDVWMEATGAFTFHVPATHKNPARFVGLMRCPVKSPEAAIAAFAKMVEANLQTSRRRGLLSHELFVRMGAPSDPIEVLGIDLWGTLEGLVEHYSDPKAITGLDAVMAGAPSASVWESSGGFNEW